MMKPVRIMTHAASDSINLLVEEIRRRGHDIKKLKVSGSSYRGTGNHLIVNYGSSSRRTILGGIDIVNDPSAVTIASDKILTFDRLRESSLIHNIPNYTTSRETAEMMVSGGFTVYCRTLTRSSEGRGIVVARTVEEIVDAPLYVQKVPRQREVRLHVFGDEVITFAQKKRRNSEGLEEMGLTEANNDVRSFNNGWVFAREGISIPTEAKEVAIKAVKALGLHFGAVDMALNLGVPKVFEINTAPGMEGQTVIAYADAIIALANV